MWRSSLKKANKLFISWNLKLKKLKNLILICLIKSWISPRPQYNKSENSWSIFWTQQKQMKNISIVQWILPHPTKVLWVNSTESVNIYKFVCMKQSILEKRVNNKKKLNWWRKIDKTLNLSRKLTIWEEKLGSLKEL